MKTTLYITNNTHQRCEECMSYHYEQKKCAKCGEPPHIGIQTRKEYAFQTIEGYKFRVQEVKRKKEELSADIRKLAFALTMKRIELRCTRKPTKKSYLAAHTYDAWVRECRANAEQDGYYFEENADSKEVAR